MAFHLRQMKPSPALQLPRLYDPPYALHGVEAAATPVASSIAFTSDKIVPAPTFDAEQPAETASSAKSSASKDPSPHASLVGDLSSGEPTSGDSPADKPSASYPPGDNPPGSGSSGGGPSDSGPVVGDPAGGGPFGGGFSGDGPTAGDPFGGGSTGDGPAAGTSSAGDPTGGAPSGSVSAGGGPFGGGPSGGGHSGSGSSGGGPSNGSPSGGSASGGSAFGAGPSDGDPSDGSHYGGGPASGGPSDGSHSGDSSSTSASFAGDPRPSEDSLPGGGPLSSSTSLDDPSLLLSLDHSITGYLFTTERPDVQLSTTILGRPNVLANPSRKVAQGIISILTNPTGHEASTNEYRTNDGNREGSGVDGGDAVADPVHTYGQGEGNSHSRAAEPTRHSADRGISQQSADPLKPSEKSASDSSISMDGVPTFPVTKFESFASPAAIHKVYCWKAVALVWCFLSPYLYYDILGRGNTFL
ncbi:MAG: hypothetical protein Q9165_008821 [Trypethelium subeluteriae]